MNSRDSLLELRGVNKKYDGFELKDLDPVLGTRLYNGFIGENGAGKTTTVKSIMNLIQIDGGKILVDGLDSVQHEKVVKEKIGFVSDDIHFYEFLKIDQMTEIIRRFYPRWDQGLYKKTIKRLDLPTNKKIKELSSGMKMKYCLATALSHGAELILLDEPSSGLDPVFRSELLEIFQDLIFSGERSIFFSSHITSDLDQVADYISLIHQGQLIFSEDQETIRDQFLNAFPVSRREVVESRYASVLLLSGGFFCLAYGLRAVLWTFGYPYANGIVSFPQLTIVILAVALYYGFLLPLYFKFGYERLRRLNFIALITVSVVSSIMGVLMMSVPVFRSWWMPLMSAGVGALIIFISMRASIKNYESRDF